MSQTVRRKPKSIALLGIAMVATLLLTYFTWVDARAIDAGAARGFPPGHRANMFDLDP